jgi:hypothetical protein
LLVKLASTALLAASLVLAPRPAHANAFGQLGGAEMVAVNGHAFGGYLLASDHAFGLLGQLRLSFYPNVDFGFQGGINRFDYGTDKRTAVELGGDMRFGVAKAAPGRPVDVALGAAIGVTTGDRYSVLTLGPEAIASRRFAMGQGGGITPYAGAMLAFSSLTVRGDSNTDFAIPLRLGAELTPSAGLNILAELQLRVGDEINDDVAFAAGVNLPF